MVTEILAEEEVPGYLRQRGVIDADEPCTVTSLPGGVSSATFRVETRGERYVVKQPLPYLSVADEWPASQVRAGIEAGAIGLLETITPQALPRLIDYDPQRYVLAMTAAPVEWAEWRQVLLAGDVDAEAGAVLGRILGSWHAATRVEEGRETPALRRFVDLAGFRELRGDPYYRTVAERRPDLAEPVLGCLEELLGPGICLVHGDFSPKNVLIAPGGAAEGLWVLDFEVAHLGNPVFDVAFCLHHLVMKAVHLRSAGAWLFDCARALLGGYADAGGLATDEQTVMRHTGALLLARVHGKSPAAYLSDPERDEVSRLGAEAVRGERPDLTTLWPT